MGTRAGGCDAGGQSRQGHLSPEDEQRIQELLAEGDATNALASLAYREEEVASKDPGYPH